MMKVLGYLLQESDVSEDDFTVAISTAINDGQYEKAISWSTEGIHRFDNSSLIRPLYIRSLRLSGDIDNASALIQNTSEAAMIENPNYLLEKAIIFYELQDMESAKKLFKDLTKLTDWPDIVTEATSYLSSIVPVAQ